MWKLLQRPHPSFQPTRRSVYMCLLAGGIVFFILYFLHPFRNSLKTNGSGSLMSAVVFGGVTAVVSTVNAWLLPLVFPRLFEEKKWKVWKEIVFYSWMILSIAAANLMVSVGFGVSRYSYAAIRANLWNTALVGVFPVAITVLLKQYLLQKKYSSEALVLNNNLKRETPSPENTASPSKKTLSLSGENQGEVLTLDPSQLLCITSADNYVRIFYLDNNMARNIIFRGTLRKMEDAMSGFQNLFRCHRMWIINLEHVREITGNAQGYRLHLPDLNEPVPVSRALNKEITTRLSHLKQVPVHP